MNVRIYGVQRDLVEEARREKAPLSSFESRGSQVSKRKKHRHDSSFSSC